MPEEIKDLNALIKNMRPKLNKGLYVFCSVPDTSSISPDLIISHIIEKEGTSIIIDVETARRLGVSHSDPMVWITLRVFSSLTAVGLTATVSKVLAQHNISCNVVAGFRHDHIFVPNQDGQKALDVLISLKGSPCRENA